VQKKLIAVNACLLGYKVRYDGEYPASEKVELHQQDLLIRLLTSSESRIDLTEKMQVYAQKFLKAHHLAGMLLKYKSSICGVANGKQWRVTGERDDAGTGFFAATAMQLESELPMLQSDLVEQHNEFHALINKVNCYGY